MNPPIGAVCGRSVQNYGMAVMRLLWQERRMAQSNAVFLQGNLFRHISVMSLTASLGLMAVFLVDFVDMIFISMLGKAELAAAVGYAGAILFFTSSFGIGMSIAAGALVARGCGRPRHWGMALCSGRCSQRLSGSILASSPR